MDMLASIRSIWIREKMNDLRAMAGKIFKREWFQYIARVDLPEFERLIQVWDTAWEDKDAADWSVCVTVGLARGAAYVLDVFRAKLETPDLLRAMKQQFARWRPQEIVIEDKSSGKAALQVLKRETGLPVVAISPEGHDKVARSRAVTPFVESGRVYFVSDAPWLQAFEDELTLFPEGENDDQVDAIVYALLRLFLGEITKMASGQVDWYGQPAGEDEPPVPARSDDEIERMLDEYQQHI